MLLIPLSLFFSYFFYLLLILELGLVGVDSGQRLVLAEPLQESKLVDGLQRLWGQL